jgi:hypothetical protein
MGVLVKAPPKKQLRVNILWPLSSNNVRWGCTIKTRPKTEALSYISATPCSNDHWLDGIALLALINWW